MDVDRIGREQYAVASELLKIVQAGVRVFFYATGQELKLDTPISSLLDAPITLTRVGDAWEYQGKTVLNRAIRGLLGWKVLAADLDQSPSSLVERSHA
jgi:hypothetical protein